MFMFVKVVQRQSKTTTMS